MTPTYNANGNLTFSGALTKAGYQPYGESGTTAGTFRYTGAQIDAETNGLYDFRARIYSPVLGRFLQVDPIGAAGGINLYAYVGNDPVNLVGPLGYAPDGSSDASSDSGSFQLAMVDKSQLPARPIR